MPSLRHLQPRQLEQSHSPHALLSTGSVVLNGLPATGTWTLTRTPGGNTTTGTGISTTISSIPPGTYTFTVTNSQGCTSVSSANVTINPPPSVPPAPVIGSITQPTCVVATGSVVLNSLPSGSWVVTRSSGQCYNQRKRTRYNPDRHQSRHLYFYCNQCFRLYIGSVSKRGHQCPTTISSVFRSLLWIVLQDLIMQLSQLQIHS